MRIWGGQQQPATRVASQATRDQPTEAARVTDHVSLYTSRGITTDAPHVRDAITVRRVMSYVVLALAPCVAVALYNTGYQANAAMAASGVEAAPGWRGGMLAAFGIAYDPSSVWDSIAHGSVVFLPVLAVSALAGSLWARVFAIMRDRDRTDGVAVIALVFTLSLPPTIPLWQAAVGMSFGVVLGREIFGGTGKNVLNPALTGLAFLYFAYPDGMRGEAVWGSSGPTALSLAAAGGMEALAEAGVTWLQTFTGRTPGALGATSTLACLLGGALLLYVQVASWRIMAGVLFGMIATAGLVQLVGAEGVTMFGVPWYWHLTLGRFAFGMVFLATDPVTAAMTNAGRWIYGLLIGFVVMLIRVANPAHLDGVMLAILLANVFAPLIDHGVMWNNIRRRARRGR
jgi:Na+-transporting NADH:ubiquinone oxidoreductase subunit B